MKNKYSIILSKYLLVFVLPLFLFSGKKEAKDPMAVMAYYVPSDNYALESIPFEKLSHIIFSFTEVIDNQMKFKREGSSQK